MTGTTFTGCQRFDELFELGAAALLAGRHQREPPPAEGGRWPASIVLRLPDVAVRLLGGWTQELLALAGPGHLLTGSPEAVHLTVRGLEPRREAADAQDPFVRRCAGAVRRVAARTAPLPLTITGVTLTPGGALAQVVAAAPTVPAFFDDLEDELGPDGWYERSQPRHILYATLLHLADDVRDPPALVEWVRAHRAVTPVTFTVDRIDVVRYDRDQGPDGAFMRPHTLGTARLGAPPPS